MVVIGGVEQKAHFFALDLPHSDACFVRAYPAAVSEAWVDGHVHAFAFFGRVPQSVLYDSEEDQETIRGIVSLTNRCLVAKILPDGSRNRAKLDLDVYPYLPKANVGTTSAASYMSLMKRGQAA